MPKITPLPQQPDLFESIIRLNSKKKKIDCILAVYTLETAETKQYILCTNVGNLLVSLTMPRNKKSL